MENFFYFINDETEQKKNTLTIVAILCDIKITSRMQFKRTNDKKNINI